MASERQAWISRFLNITVALSFMDTNLPGASDATFFFDSLTEAPDKLFDSCTREDPMLSWRQRLLLQKMTDVKLSDVLHHPQHQHHHHHQQQLESLTGAHLAPPRRGATPPCLLPPAAVAPSALSPLAAITDARVLHHLFLDDLDHISGCSSLSSDSTERRASQPPPLATCSSPPAATAVSAGSSNTASWRSSSPSSDSLLHSDPASNHALLFGTELVAAAGGERILQSRRKSISNSEEALLQKVSISERDLAVINSDQFMRVCSHVANVDATVLKDIRRRNKNKMAARDCRKRRMEVQEHLAEHVRELEARATKLKKRLERLTLIRDGLRSAPL